MVKNINSINGLSTKQIKDLYNIYRLVRAEELPRLSKTYKNNLKTILVLMKRKPKRPTITLSDIIKEIKSVKDELKSEIAKINIRIDLIVKANNLVDPTSNPLKRNP